MAGGRAEEGVLVLAYGTPRGPDEVEAYYTDIRRGRPPTPEQLADLVRRYHAIGGVSPLRARTEAQRAGLDAALAELEPGRFRVVAGFKHARPSIEDAVDELADAGVAAMTAVVLAPHYSALSVGGYLARAGDRAGERGVAFGAVESWHLDGAYVRFLAAAVAEGVEALPSRTACLFTAHSLPARILDTGDPYPAQLRETAAAVASVVGLPEAVGDGPGWRTGWQSAGRTPEPWLGPDLGTLVRDLAAGGAVDGILVIPCGFVADHLEVLYDVDIEARRVAAEAGLAFARTPVVNADQAVLAGLAARVRAAADAVAVGR
ncbi:MAG: ferrochelatase [Acidimicrobiia bacterium]